MLNKEQKDKLKLIVESIDEKLTKEGYIFTARHFDVVMDGMWKALQQNIVIGSVSKCPECLQPTPQDELDMFGGLCEECSGAFDE